MLKKAIAFCQNSINNPKAHHGLLFKLNSRKAVALLAQNCILQSHTAKHKQLESSMKSASKKIVRASKESAEKAMSNHIEKMKAKGWEVDKEFGGNCGCSYECITWFFKA